MTLTLRMAMVSREGERETAFQIGRGLRAFAVERDSPVLHRTVKAIVFGKSPSDAKRRAAAPARLAEECHGDVTRVAPIATGWDEPIQWPEILS
jgi:hypothetical protein